MATDEAEDVAAVGEVSIIAILSVLWNNGSKDLVCSIMVMVMLLLQITFCDDSEQSSMLCGDGATVCFLCEVQLDMLLQTWQTCIM